MKKKWQHVYRLKFTHQIINFSLFFFVFQDAKSNILISFSMRGKLQYLVKRFESIREHLIKVKVMKIFQWLYSEIWIRKRKKHLKLFLRPVCENLIILVKVFCVWNFGLSVQEWVKKSVAFWISRRINWKAALLPSIIIHQLTAVLFQLNCVNMFVFKSY